MRRDYASVGPDTTLEQLVNDHILGSGRRSLVIEKNNKVMGLLTVHDIKKVERAEWPNTTAGQVMIPIEQMKRIAPSAELVEALGEMDRDGVSQLPVMNNDQMQGMLGRDDVISLLRNLGEFSRT
jgi:CIC family chloride channel protein